ncbi:Arrestin-N domain-containing protein [Mycena sanguinolenta]|uniref:Arrestin-N domain-containing protein n=1 Tax=Mycena sanguinolenta TaxID=230812 RepID=A0A8H6XMJ4_9AGAR|nr:Arrestin-N domain-containing protein [Mycena sanguinolenta]
MRAGTPRSLQSCALHSPPYFRSPHKYSIRLGSRFPQHIMTSDSSSTQPFTLHFQNIVRVAGEVIEGRVDVHVPLMHEDGIEHVRIEMQGVIKTTIYRQYGQVSVLHKQTVPLCSSSQILWTPESTQSDADVASYPFQFTLPEDLPPSFCYGKYSPPDATIRYSLEIIGERPGVFHRNRRVRRVFLVMPAASESQLLASESLRQGWEGPWKVTTKDAKVRQGIWGDYSHVYATLSLPDLPSFPISTPIPYTLHVVTETKTLDRSDRPEKHGKPLFPLPPTQTPELSQVLRRKIEYVVHEKLITHKEKRKDTFDLQKSQSLVDNTASSRVRRAQTTQTQPMESAQEVDAVVDEPEWIPKDEKGRGIWRRSVHFTSTLAFPFAPTASTETINWEYTLQFTIPFPGIGNDLELELPIHLSPTSACPPPPTGAPGSSSLTYADVLPAGPPPMFDLPPTYWSNDDHDWDDEKNEKK